MSMMCVNSTTVGPPLSSHQFISRYLYYLPSWCDRQVCIVYFSCISTENLTQNKNKMVDANMGSPFTIKDNDLLQVQ